MGRADPLNIFIKQLLTPCATIYYPPICSKDADEEAEQEGDVVADSGLQSADESLEDLGRMEPMEEPAPSMPSRGRRTLG